MKRRTASQVGKMSRRKGKRFENWVARYFSRWTGLDWQSTRNSGRTDLKGDIYCVSRPDLPLIVECKDDKTYSVHAMLKPTKAFTDVITQIRSRARKEGKLIILIKNETGVWFSGLFGVSMLSYSDGVATKGHGVFVRLEHLKAVFEINGVIFNAKRMEAAGS